MNKPLAPTPADSAPDSLASALAAAVRGQNAPLVRRLLAAGADPNGKDAEGGMRPLLHSAITTRQDSGVLALLLAAGARPDARDACGDTSLMVATRAGNSWAVRQLLAAGADSSAPARAQGGLSAPQAAHAQLSTQRTHRRADVVRMLDKGRQVLPPRELSLLRKLIVAVRRGRGADIRHLLAEGAPLNGICPEQLEAPLHCAVATGDMKVLRQLIAAGADVNLLSAYGRTPLMRAMGQGRSFVVSALLQAGADVNRRDPQGLRALDYCSDSECRRLLLAHGALRGKDTAPEEG